MSPRAGRGAQLASWERGSGLVDQSPFLLLGRVVYGCGGV